MVLDPKGPQAERQASDIMLSIGIMSCHYHCCVAIAIVLCLLSIVLQNKVQIMNHLTLKESWVETICGWDSSY